ncbi:unnamed protein product [Medioppia subpectinata]|uniref:Uncharacterized protein n=1 Tax=Medioppia subpectinata TaxID=1979941 RepID=A0A7R9LMY9_9ACAR|nr:unnamed protein product [Medioppia subpectinata]CAG2120204.1 unnamed protein product [Medioppia subpectinata]
MLLELLKTPPNIHHWEEWAQQPMSPKGWYSCPHRTPRS